MEEQQNRQHKKNQKLDKKRNKLKEIKKNKKLQKKQQLLLKPQKRSNFFAQNDKKNKNVIDRQKVIQTFKLFLKIYQDDLDDFFQLFKQLDQGHVIETADIQNPNIKTILEKFMKKLQLKNQGTQQAPIFKKQSDIKLEPFVRSLYDEIIQNINQQQQLQSDSSDSQSSRSQSPQKQLNQEQNNHQQVLNTEKEKNLKKQQQKVKKLKEEVYQDKKYDRNSVRNSLYADFEIKTKKQVQDNQNLDSFLEDQFSKVELTNVQSKEQNIKKKVKTEQQPIIDLNKQIQVQPDKKKQLNFIQQQLIKKDFNRQTNLNQEDNQKFLNKNNFLGQIQNQFF
ncbi:unnamed protein product [Paramecium sonneborni]|uniref:Uncharacterized protein n=1 Tax=Paramecium sonneborni TaxID=65129 RepID=A0A8S1KLX7_9CILI|nr:unnamed protein product [Paramecium sonneborni]